MAADDPDMNTPYRLINIQANLGGEYEGKTRNMALVGSCFGYCVERSRLKHDRARVIGGL